MSAFLEAIGFGLVTAAIIALASVAVSLQISVTNFINFAYGDFMTFGAYIAWAANSRGVNFVAAVVLGCLATGLLGVAAHYLVFRPFMRQGKRPVILMVAGLGLALIVQNVIVIIWGTDPQHYSLTVGSALHIGPFLLTPGDLILIGASALLLGLLHAMLRYTKFGKSLRATSDNVDLAQACGVDINQVITATWFIAGVLTAVSGVGLALESSVLQPATGFDELFIILGAVILGGIGRPYGAMLGALVLGIVTEVSGMYVDAEYKSAIAFGVVILLLVLRPNGLLAEPGKTS